MVKRKLGFFAASKSLAEKNIVLAIYRHLTNPECRHYLLRQAFEEAVHTHTFQFRHPPTPPYRPMISLSWPAFGSISALVLSTVLKQRESISQPKPSIFRASVRSCRGIVAT